MNGARIRVLIFLHDLAPFGAQRVALGIVRGLDPGTFLPAVCGFGRDACLENEFRAAGAGVIRLNAGRYLDGAAWSGFFSLLLRFRPDIVQTNMPELSVPVRFRSLPAGFKVVHSVQNPLSSEPLYWRLLNRLTFPLCGKVIFSSLGIFEESGLGGPGFAVIQNAMEAPSPVPGLRAELGIRPDEKVVCCVARLSPQKGQDVLLRAAALLYSRGKAVRLLLAGDGEDRRRLESLAAGPGLSGKVLFLGRRSDVPAVFATADICAAPSRWEGLSLSLGEAMLAGLPCAATDIPGHRDILKDGVTGLAVPPDRPEALAAAIERLMDDPQTAARLAAAGRDLVSRNFSPEAMARGYAAVYSSLAGRGA